MFNNNNNRNDDFFFNDKEFFPSDSQPQQQKFGIVAVGHVAVKKPISAVDYIQRLNNTSASDIPPS